MAPPPSSPSADIRPVTMADIAAHVGVSRPAVSTVLGGRNSGIRVSEATRRRIVAAADQLGYRPSASARATRTGRTGVIALLESSDSYTSYRPAKLVEGIHRQAADHDLSLLLDALPDDQLTSEGFVPKILRELACDGMLINYQFHIPQKMIELIHRHTVPSIWINSRQSGDCVHIDDFNAGVDLTRHVIELGHRRIAYIDHSNSWDALSSAHYSARDRADGYAQAMRNAGLAPSVHRPENLIGIRERIELSHAILQRETPTAVITYSAKALHYINLAAIRLGLDIPTDLSVAAFDAAHFNEFGIVATLARLPYDVLGSQAVRMLCQRIKDPSLSLPVEAIRAQIKPGQSTQSIG